MDELRSSARRWSAARRGRAPRSRSPRGSRSGSIGCCCTGRTPTGRRSRHPRSATRSPPPSGRTGVWDRACWPTSSSARRTARPGARFARHQRAAARPRTAAALLELVYRTDVRPAARAGARADGRCAPPRRPRDPLRVRADLAGSMRGAARSARRQTPTSVGRRPASASRARSDRAAADVPAPTPPRAARCCRPREQEVLVAGRRGDDRARDRSAAQS